MNEFTLACTVYGLLQVGSLALLPRWWKAAALPSLYAVPWIWDYFRTGGGYMGDVFVIMFCIYACAYLVAVWVVWGLTKLAQQLFRALRRSIGDESILRWLGGVPVRFWQWCRRRPVAAACAGLLAVLAIALIGICIHIVTRPPRLAANADGSLTMKGYNRLVTSLAFSPDGRRLATVGWDQRITLWNTTDWNMAMRIRCHSDVISAVAFSPDGRRLATGSWDRTVRLWDARTGLQLNRFRRQAHTVDAVAFDAEGRRLAAVVRSGQVVVWNIDSRRELFRKRGTGFVMFTHDGRHIASRPQYNQLVAWDAVTGDETLVIHNNSDLAGITDDPASDSITAAAFCPPGKLLAIGCRDGTVKLYDAQTGHHLTALAGHTDSVLSVVFDPGGKRLASSSLDGSLRLWNVDTGRETATRHGDVISLAFSPDGKLLAGANRLNGSFTVWQPTIASPSEVTAQ